MSYSILQAAAGLGAEGVSIENRDRDCPLSTKVLGPTVSQEMKTWLAGNGKSYRRTFCQSEGSDLTKQLCNKTSAPVVCYIAKMGNTRDPATGVFRNRMGQADGTQADWEAWARWMPTAVEASVRTDTTPVTAAAPETNDALFYGAIAVGALLLGGGIWYATK